MSVVGKEYENTARSDVLPSSIFNDLVNKIPDVFFFVMDAVFSIRKTNFLNLLVIP